MNKKILTYMAFGTALMLSACADDAPAPKGQTADGNRIYFRSYLPDVSLSRAADVTTLSQCRVTCFNANGTVNDAGKMIPYFEDINFENDGSGRFFSTEGECNWPDANSTLHFFAYYPSAASMKAKAGDTFFNLDNASVVSDGIPAIDYRLKNFRVADNIADQADFITAYASASLSSTQAAADGIKLDFKHQLSRIELTAWGANDKYDFEIAGVRIGNPIVEGDFNFSSLASGGNDVPSWLYPSPTQAPVEYIFGEDEPTVLLSKSAGSHATEDTRGSIMGKSVAAMLIPTPEKIEAWEGKADPKTASPDYTTDKMYFSVLLRVKNRDGGVAYPYTDSNGMKTVHLAIDKSSRTVKKRLYKFGDYYYTTPQQDEASKYALAESEEICKFGWAALPVPAKWDAGKKYTYKLNYSDGIGWHDPADPEPGEPIIERGGIPFTVNVTDWVAADDFDSDINVPKR